MKIPVLIDFDGIIKLGNEPAKETAEFFEFISSKRIKSYIISNSTLRTSTDILAFLKKNNLDFNIPAMTAVDATYSYVKNNYKRIAIYCNKNIRHVFKELIDDKKPEAVVVGDLGSNWTYDIINDIFRKVNDGADFIAMQKNKFWKPNGEELFLDAGTFIKAIEFAALKEAILIGKPSPIYFCSALEQLGWEKDEPFFMIGDDLETDIGAAQKIGGKGILVFTGKTNYPIPQNYPIKPDFEAKNLRDVIEILSSF